MKTMRPIQIIIITTTTTTTTTTTIIIIIIIIIIIVGAKTPNHVMGFGTHPGRLANFEERKWLLKGFPT